MIDWNNMNILKAIT